MKLLFIFLLLCFSFQAYTAIAGERIGINLDGTYDSVIHVQEVYKTIDTLKLKTDIFYTSQSFERENNTAIIFFHGGGWA